MYENIVKVNMIREEMKIMGDTFQLFANIFIIKVLYNGRRFI